MNSTWKTSYVRTFVTLSNGSVVCTTDLSAVFFKSDSELYLSFTSGANVSLNYNDKPKEMKADSALILRAMLKDTETKEMK